MSTRREKIVRARIQFLFMESASLGGRRAGNARRTKRRETGGNHFNGRECRDWKGNLNGGRSQRTWSRSVAHMANLAGRFLWGRPVKVSERASR